MKPQGFFSRLVSLWRGFWSSNLRGTETRNPQYVYESALHKRRANFQKLKESTSRLILLRNRTRSKIQANQETLKLLEASINKAATVNNDAKAIALIRKKQISIEQNERLENDISRLEEWIDTLNDSLEPLKDFILPGGGPVGSWTECVELVVADAEFVCDLQAT